MGALQLVPPIPIVRPWNTSRAPVLGSAAEHTSGTNRCVPGDTPDPTCHVGREKNRLLPPPLPVQPFSLVTAPAALRCKLVPPTPITVGSEASYSAWRGPVGLCPVLSGFEPAS